MPKQNRKLFAANATNEVGRAAFAPELLAYRRQNLVTGEVAVVLIAG